MEWIQRYFSDAEAYTLHVGNKPLLEFFIEFCVLNEIKDIYIALKPASGEIKESFGDGSKWDINLNYIELKKERELEEVIDSHKDLFTGDDLLVFNGFFFLQYKKSHLSKNFLPQDYSWQNLSKSGHGLLFLKSSTAYKPEKPLKHFEGKRFLLSKDMNSIKDYFELNMDMVAGGAKNYIMPSYNSERGVFIGQNVEIMYDCEITRPIIIGDDIQLKKHSHIGPSVIIGSNSLIDSDTSVHNSIIYCNSYIGTKLEINNKIVYKRRLIDPDSGDMIHIVDDFLVSEVRNDLITSVMTRILELVLICLLFCLQLPLYLILRPWVECSYEKMAIWQDASGLRKTSIKRFISKADKNANKLFVKFSLHKFHLLLWCVSRRLRLIGSVPQKASKEGLQNIQELSNYRPAAFSYSDMYGCERDNEIRQVHEVFYAKHTTLGINAAIFFKTLIFNFFGTVYDKRH